ncbi:thioredoxin-like protein AAED1, chloroplastic [Abrus precatorius]|uniref:Thioredoxin-like protein AAED1, chloroplastic n=1 Tax=Abrus precatorius TaxID=3816 RepID=A0A8B8KVZ8_ABRPR|nr:thioredoxin-like protein AAED1, chloroplastic [Abrus precatorius]
MSTLQSLRPSFHPSISPPNSHTFPFAPVNYSPKSMGSKVVTLRHSAITPRASNSEYTPAHAENLGDVSIFTASGEPVLFKDLWDQSQGVAVVALLRHFGCPCSWELASALKESKERFDSTGVKLIAVGVGTPNKARMLAERLPFPMDCLYADPDRKAYNVLNLYYGFGRTFLNPVSAQVFSRFDALQKAVKNYTIAATPDDRSGVLQQGGMFVFKGKQLLYARKDEGTGDHAPLDDVFDVCCKAPVA